MKEKINPEKYYIRRDNKIAGPFNIVNNNKFWDKTNHILYHENGLVVTELIIKSDEDLVSICENYRKPFIKINDKKQYINRNLEIINNICKNDNGEFYDIMDNYYHENGLTKNESYNNDLIMEFNNETREIIKFIKDIVSGKINLELDDDDICLCETCIKMRDELDKNGSTILTRYINELYLNLKYIINLDNFIDIPNLDMKKISTYIQLDLLTFLIDFNKVFGNTEKLKEIRKKYEDDDFFNVNKITNDTKIYDKLFNGKEIKEISEEKNSDDEVMKIPIIRKINSLIDTNFKEKNVLIKLNMEKILNMSEKDLLMYYTSIELTVSKLPKFEKIKIIKPMVIIPNTTKKEINNFGFIRNKLDKNTSFNTILNPEYIFSISIENGEIVSVVPLMKK